MFPIEGDRWIVTVQGVAEDRPPAHDDDFLGFAARLRSTVIYDAIRDAEPLTPVVTFANTANRRRHYDGLPRWPERLLAVGDSACRRSTRCTARGCRSPPRARSRWMRSSNGTGARTTRSTGSSGACSVRVATEGDAAWMIATGDDLRMPTTTGAKVTAATNAAPVSGSGPRRGTTDETVLSAMLNVFFLLAPPRRPCFARRSSAGRCVAARSPHRRVPRQCRYPITVRVILSIGVAVRRHRLAPMPRFGRVLTAMVTPFDDDGARRRRRRRTRPLAGGQGNDGLVRRRHHRRGADADRRREADAVGGGRRGGDDPGRRRHRHQRHRPLRAPHRRGVEARRRPASSPCARTTTARRRPASRPTCGRSPRPPTCR